MATARVDSAHQHRPERTRVALKYKQLWTVEAIFRTMKSQLDTRPIFHKTDDTIRGHVFCSFLALVLREAQISGKASAASRCRREGAL